MEGEPPLDIVIALHVGTAHYGNIGAADRLDFTVIGPSVNLVSRIENAANFMVIIPQIGGRSWRDPPFSSGWRARKKPGPNWQNGFDAPLPFPLPL